MSATRAEKLAERLRAASVGTLEADAAAPELARRMLEARAPAPLAPLPAQLDLDGTAHEIAPETERMRLFTPAPAQLAGQTYMDTDNESEQT